MIARCVSVCVSVCVPECVCVRQSVLVCVGVLPSCCAQWLRTRLSVMRCTTSPGQDIVRNRHRCELPHHERHCCAIASSVLGTLSSSNRRDHSNCREHNTVSSQAIGINRQRRRGEHRQQDTSKQFQADEPWCCVSDASGYEFRRRKRR